MNGLRTVMLLSGLTWLSITATAQDKQLPQEHRISAGEAVQLALKQRSEMLNAKLDIQNQEAFNKEVTGMALPQVKGNLGVQHFFNIPVTVLPDFLSPSVYGVLTGEGVRDGNGAPIKMPSSFGTLPARFGVPWQASLGLSVQQLLFQPDVFVGLKARATALELYQNQLKIQEDSVKSSVYRTYYGVLIAQKGLGFIKESEQRLSKLYSDQEQLYKNGFIEKLDIEKTLVSLNNVRSAITQLQNLVEVSYAALKLTVQVPQQDKLILTDSLTNDMVREDVLSLSNDFSYNNRPEVQTMKTSEKLLDLQVKRYKLNAYPTVAAAWNLATNAQRETFSFFDTKERWFFSNYVGLNVSVPVFDGFQRRNKVKQAEIAAEKNRNSLRQLENVIDFQVESARIQLTNAITALNNQEANKELAERVFNTTKTKYQSGLGSSFELLQTEASLQTALNNYYQALYDAVIAKINYKKAVGKL